MSECLILRPLHGRSVVGRSVGFRGLLASVLAVALAGCTQPATEVDDPSESPALEPSATPSTSAEPSRAVSDPRTNARIVRVIDGDTVEAIFRGTTIDIRLIGIDTPETVLPSEPIECYGPAASRFTAKRLDGRRVRLAFDVERIDRYGRTLAYIWLGGKLFNERLVRDGFATVSTYPPNVKYVDRFLAAQRYARSHERGFWGGCPAMGPNDGGGGTGGTGGGANCDPSYPGVCIPPNPPDLDCGDLSVVNFDVVPPDPHGFDGDRDGVGCET